MKTVVYYRTKRKTSVPRKVIRAAVREIFGPLFKAEGNKPKTKKVYRYSNIEY